MTVVSENHDTAARTVHDFDAVLAEIAESEESRAVLFNFKGREFSIPAPLDWPDEVVELQAQAAAGNADPVALARAFLGADEYAEFQRLGGNAMRFMKFFERVMGGTLGESPAS